VVDRASSLRRVVLLTLVAVALAAGCTSSDSSNDDNSRESYGGAADLPGPLPQGVDFRKPPRSALIAPDFSVDLLDGTPVTGDDLWDDRPLVVVFTASWCDTCAGVHREVAGVVDEHDGAIGLLGMVREDDAEDARDYAQNLQLGYPIAVGDENVWLNYAADEPPLVVLIAHGGKVLRGWPGDIEAGDLAEELEGLFRGPAERDE